MSGIFIPKFERIDYMLGTLILLYALDTGHIPTACYVFAWVFAILEYIYRSVKQFDNGKRFFNMTLDEQERNFGAWKPAD